MNQTMYQRRGPVSPYQPKPQHPIELLRAKTYDLQDKTNPIREAIEKFIGTHTITLVVAEDLQTLDVMKAEGLVSFICTLTNTKDGRVLSQGRGSAMIGPMNKYFQRSIACAFNSSIADAAIRASKILDQVRDKSAVEEAYANEGLPEPATEPQLKYLQQLITVNVKDDGTLTWWQNRLGEISKSEASDAIKSFSK